MKKIGLVFNSNVIDELTYSFLKKISDNQNLAIYITINDEIKYPKKKGFKYHYDSLCNAFLNVYIKIELYFFSLRLPYLDKVKKKFSVLDILKLSNRLKEVLNFDGINDLDLIIVDTSSIVVIQKYAPLTKDGVVYLTPDSIYADKSISLFFWPIFFKEPGSKFSISIYQSNQKNYIIFEGILPTQKSISENIYLISSIQKKYLIKIINDYVNSGKVNYKFKSDVSILSTRVPSPTTVAKYLENLSMFAYKALSMVANNEKLEWNVCYSKNSWKNSNLSSGNIITNPSGRYFADPFIIKREGRTICFVEDYSQYSKRGCITAIEIFNEKKYEIIGPVITEPFHMSFPFIFEYRGILYMTPETSEAKSIKLYKCINFPTQWQFQRNLLTEDEFLDTIIFKKDGQWNLLTNLPDYSLNLYFSQDPTSSNWIPNSKNPVLLDSSLGRNGGILFDESGDVIRCRQKHGFNTYGASLTLAKITNISISNFEELKIREIDPIFFRKIKGCHHINSNDDFTVYDFLR